MIWHYSKLYLGHYMNKGFLIWRKVITKVSVFMGRQESSSKEIYGTARSSSPQYIYMCMGLQEINHQSKCVYVSAGVITGSVWINRKVITLVCVSWQEGNHHSMCVYGSAGESPPQEVYEPARKPLGVLGDYSPNKQIHNSCQNPQLSLHTI